MSDAVWVSLAMGDARRLRPFTNDLAADAKRLIAIQTRNNAGEVLNKDDFPEAIWGSKERGARTFKSLPDLFYGYGFWVVSERCADVMNGFDLGSGRLHPVKVFEKDKATPIGDHGWFCWNFGNKKPSFCRKGPRILYRFPEIVGALRPLLVTMTSQFLDKRSLGRTYGSTRNFITGSS